MPAEVLPEAFSLRVVVNLLSLRRMDIFMNLLITFSRYVTQGDKYECKTRSPVDRRER
jgi:hypothetical protein